MALAHEVGATVIEPQCNDLEISSMNAARVFAGAVTAAGIDIPSFGGDLSIMADQAAMDARMDFTLEVARILGAWHLYRPFIAPLLPLLNNWSA